MQQQLKKVHKKDLVAQEDSFLKKEFMQGLEVHKKDLMAQEDSFLKKEMIQGLESVKIRFQTIQVTKNKVFFTNNSFNCLNFLFI